MTKNTTFAKKYFGKKSLNIDDYSPQQGISHQTLGNRGESGFQNYPIIIFKMYNL